MNATTAQSEATKKQYDIIMEEVGKAASNGKTEVTIEFLNSDRIFKTVAKNLNKEGYDVRIEPRWPAGYCNIVSWYNASKGYQGSFTIKED